MLTLKGKHIYLRALEPDDLDFVHARITSYNVCYTKLLRVFLDISFFTLRFHVMQLPKHCPYLNVCFRSRFLRRLSTLPVSAYLRVPYFLKLLDLSTFHAYTWCLKTSKNNFNKERYFIRFSHKPDFYVVTNIAVVAKPEC